MDIGVQYGSSTLSVRGRHIISTDVGVQYRGGCEVQICHTIRKWGGGGEGGTPSVQTRMCSREEVHHQDGRKCTLQWRLAIHTDAGVQYGSVISSGQTWVCNTEEGVKYRSVTPSLRGGGTPSVQTRMCSREEVHHQDGRKCTLQWRPAIHTDAGVQYGSVISSVQTWVCSTEEGVKYRSVTPSVRGGGGGGGAHLQYRRGCAVGRRYTTSMDASVHYSGGPPSIRTQACSTDQSYHQFRRECAVQRRV